MKREAFDPGCRSPLKYFGGATQLLWDNLRERKANLESVRASLGNCEDPNVKLCEWYLERAQDEIDRFAKRPFSFWSLIHRFDELLLRAMPEPMLAACALDILANFERKITDPETRKTWLGENGGPLYQAVRRLTSNGGATRPAGTPDHSEDQVRRDREVLASALHVVNDQTDIGFWHLATNSSIQDVSAVMLIVVAVLMFWLARQFFRNTIPQGDLLLRPDVIMLFGAAGAVVSNMFRRDPFVSSIGPSMRYVVFAVFAKPIVGAFTALFVALLEQSQLVFQIVTDSSSNAAQPPSHAAIRIFVGSPAAAEFARVVMAIVAGISGERLLRSMVGKVQGRLFEAAEKGTRHE
jgi:hypothetical protein